METKQVIVIRKDLNMRKGKMVAQGAHASMNAILKQMWHMEDWNDGIMVELQYEVRFDEPTMQWICGQFTKIVVYVNSELELLELYDKAKEAKITCSLIKDNGKTEFNGVPTHTCIAIGPGYVDDIDKITGHLPLL